jgi:hypothetical protein
MVDMYFRENNLNVFGEKFIEIESDLDLFITQIQMILDTPLGSVYNNPRFGNSLSRYLHEFNADGKEMRTHVQGQIQLFCPLHRDIPFSVDVKFFQGETGNLAVVDISIDARKVLGVIVK